MVMKRIQNYLNIERISKGIKVFKMDPATMSMLRSLSQEQQILYMAMMMDPKQIPMFNQDIMADILNTGKIIKEMFTNGKFNTMRMLKNGRVVIG